jgi:hypothetical protein
MSWNKESISAERKPIVEARFADSTREDLLAHIVRLEADLYPFVYVLGSIDTNQPRGTTVTSKLFPRSTDSKTLQVYDSESREFGEVTDVPEAELHDVEYEEQDSLTIVDGTLLNDEFSILHVHQQAPGAYVSCGHISMADVREARTTLYPDTTPKQED